MIESVQVESVSVPVSDQDQAKEFYVDTLASNCWLTIRGEKGCVGQRWSPRTPLPRSCW